MDSNKTNSRIPELRFPGFEGEWEVRKIEDSFEERIEKNRSDLPLLSLGEDGLMLQSESQRKDNSNSDKSKYLRVAVGDIAYNTMRMWQGRCVYCNIEGIVSPAYTVCKTKEGIDPLFHYYLFKTNQMISIFHQHSQGLVNDTLNLKYEAFSKIKYLLPSLPEQQKIADCLSSVDHLIQEETDQLQALNDHKKGLMQQLFPQEGETIPKRRFPGFEGEWRKRKFENCFEIGSGRDYKHLSDGDIPVYGSGGYMCSVNDYLYDGDSACIGRKGTINKPMLLQGKFWTVDTLFYTYNYEDTSAYFIYLLFQNIDWMKHNEAGGVPSLSKSIIYNISVRMPKLPEQQKIADCLSSIDEEISAQQQKVAELKEHKKGLMQKLFPNLQ